MKSLELFNLLLMFLLSISCSCLAKECSNKLPVSHQVRYDFIKSKNETWKREVLAHHDHVPPSDDSTWSSLRPRKMLREEEDDEFSWAMMYRKMKNPEAFKIPENNFLKELSLHDIQLGKDSLHWRAQQTNLEYLLMIDVDRLVWSFRKTAGFPAIGKPHGGWEDPTSQLRGHFIGHYMSATARMWASTHNNTLKEKMSAVVSILSQCQKKIGSGYLSAFPSKYFDQLETLRPVWAPYYTIHKILAGLLDQHEFADNPDTLKMAKWMVDYFYIRVQRVIQKYSVARHWEYLNEEPGGMNDVLYRLYGITKDPRHLFLAHLFDKPCFLGLLAVQASELSGFHVNTHIPLVVGTQTGYEVTGDPLQRELGTFFMNLVNSSHIYATGGTSDGEFWHDPNRLATTLGDSNEESCTTYNLLKVSRNLFRWTKKMEYADHYERALTNGVLSIQRGTSPGEMIYLLPLGPGSSKERTSKQWGTPFETFWCCYGTATESFSKLGDSIYFEEEGNIPGLHIIQYISSSLDWKSGQIVLNQKVDPVVSGDPYLQVTFTFSPKGAGKASSLSLRIPSWTNSNGAKATLNGQTLALPSPGNFLYVNKTWTSNDKLTMQLPLNLRTEAIKDDRPKYASLHAILYGPYLLAANSQTDCNISESAKSLSDWITPIPASYNSHLVTFSKKTENSTFVLTHSNSSITMERFNISGTDTDVQSTFRLILKDPSSSSEVSSRQDFIGKSVMLEPFSFPGMLVADKGKQQELMVTDSSTAQGSFIFHLVAGLDGSHDTVSLESASHKGCYVYSLDSDTSMKLICSTKSTNAEFNYAVSFVMEEGKSKYHPISFLAKGTNRNYILEPLLKFRDESYTVYLNFHS